jgi:hypothetical protein
MKRRSLFIIVAVFVLSCNNDASKNAGNADSTKKEEAKSSETSLTMPYTASYSSQFSMGDQKNAEKMLILFKQWDDNKLADGKNMFADSVSFMSDRWNFNGTNDSFQSVSQKQRNLFKEVKTVVHAWIPVKSTDKNEDWVLVWSTAYTTDLKGKVDSVTYQDTWRLNKNGQFDRMLSYIQRSPEAKK